jgi:hypothetical protein
MDVMRCGWKWTRIHPLFCFFQVGRYPCIHCSGSSSQSNLFMAPTKECPIHSYSQVFTNCCPASQQAYKLTFGSTSCSFCFSTACMSPNLFMHAMSSPLIVINQLLLPTFLSHPDFSNKMEGVTLIMLQVG